MEKTENGVDSAEDGGFGADSKEAGPMAPGGRSAKKLAAIVSVQPKNRKSLKGETRHNGAVTTVKKQKPEVSNSHPSPSKGKLASGVRKNASESKATMTDIKAPESRASKVVSPVINGSSEGSGAKQSGLGIDLETNATPPAENIAVRNDDSNGQSVETPPVSDNNPLFSSHSENLKSGEDAHSNTLSTSPRVSSTQRRNSGSGFLFRLDERAEKRKEFLQKLEEKIQAKEAEKNDLQARSNVNQEAEIKKLRQTLTFKATPMPSFYKDPGLPKAELKKMPVTRAVSPKLGRAKPLTDTEDSTFTKHDDPSANANVESLAPKKTIKKSVSRSPSQKTTKPITKSLETKVSKPKKKVVDAADVQENLQVPQNSNKNVDEHLNNAAGNNTEDTSVLTRSSSIPTHTGQVSAVG